jgi:hypothetical protein
LCVLTGCYWASVGVATELLAATGGWQFAEAVFAFTTDHGPKQ